MTNLHQDTDKQQEKHNLDMVEAPAQIRNVNIAAALRAGKIDQALAEALDAAHCALPAPMPGEETTEGNEEDDVVVYTLRPGDELPDVAQGISLTLGNMIVRLVQIPGPWPTTVQGQVDFAQRIASELIWKLLNFVSTVNEFTEGK